MQNTATHSQKSHFEIVVQVFTLFWYADANIYIHIQQNYSAS